MEEIRAKLDKIEQSVEKIEIALLGNLDRTQRGLLVETEQLRKEVDEIKPALAFYKNAKVIVGAIALVVPFLFEVIKLAVGNLWNVVK